MKDLTQKQLEALRRRCRKQWLQEVWRSGGNPDARAGGKNLKPRRVTFTLTESSYSWGVGTRFHLDNGGVVEIDHFSEEVDRGVTKAVNAWDAEGNIIATVCNPQVIFYVDQVIRGLN